MKGPGYCYAATYWNKYNKPELSHVKIGYFTTKEIEQAIYNNYSRILSPLCVILIIPCFDASLGETIIHRGLESVRRDPKHEIFDLSEKIDSFFQIADMIIKLNFINGKSLDLKYNIDWQKWAYEKKLLKIERKLDFVYKQKDSKKNIKNNNNNDKIEKTIDIIESQQVKEYLNNDIIATDYINGDSTKNIKNISNNNDKIEKTVDMTESQQVKEFLNDNDKIEKTVDMTESQQVKEFLNDNIIATVNSTDYIKGTDLWKLFNKYRIIRNIKMDKKSIII